MREVRPALLTVLVIGALVLLGCTGAAELTAAPSSLARDDDARPRVTLVQSLPSGTTGLEAPSAESTAVVWRKAIDEATERIDLATFYISPKTAPGGLLRGVLDSLEAAGARGVTVRVLIDALFADKYPDAPRALEQLPGVEVRSLDLREVGGVQHAKYLVVDRRLLYVGSANMDWRALEHIHELGVLVRDRTLAVQLTQVFEHDWRQAGNAAVRGRAGEAWKPVSIDDQELWLTASPKTSLPSGGRWELPALVALLDGATESVRVQLLSYDAAYRDGTAWRQLQEALARAAKRGVAVRLVLSHWQRSHLEAVRALQASGVRVVLVRIPEHTSGAIPFARVVHAKYMVVDQRVAWVGTSNWKGDYFYKSRNVGIVVRGGSLPERLEALHDRVFSSPYATPVD